VAIGALELAVAEATVDVRGERVGIEVSRFRCHAVAMLA
jgi:hypothetical protein